MNSVEIKKLTGKWKLKYQPLKISPNKVNLINKQEQGWLEASVPGDIHQDFINAGPIPEPTQELNSQYVVWTREKSWWLTKQFTVSSSMLKKASALELVLDGLDYTARIFINNTFIAEHKNAFRPFVYDIKPSLVAGQFIYGLTQVPAGLADFVIAGLIAAATSSLDSAINACASTVTNDFYEIFYKEKKTQKANLIFGRWASVVFSVIMIALALFAVGSSYILRWTNKKDITDLSIMTMKNKFMTSGPKICGSCKLC